MQPQQRLAFEFGLLVHFFIFQSQSRPAASAFVIAKQLPTTTTVRPQASP
jgi:hypothetical protein